MRLDLLLNRGGKLHGAGIAEGGIDADDQRRRSGESRRRPGERVRRSADQGQNLRVEVAVGNDGREAVVDIDAVEDCARGGRVVETGREADSCLERRSPGEAETRLKLSEVGRDRARLGDRRVGSGWCGIELGVPAQASG